MRTAAASILLLAGLAACASPAGQGASTTTAGAASGRQCFPVQSVNGFSAVDRDTINVTVGVRDVYQLELFGTCQDVDWANVVGLRARGGGSFICDALDVDVIAPSVIGPQTCRVTAMRKLSDEEVAALRGRPRSGS